MIFSHTKSSSLFLLLFITVSANNLHIIKDDFEEELIKEFHHHCINENVNGDITRLQRENCLPGNGHREWDVNAAGDPSIQGFAQPFSNKPGGKVKFKVKTVSDKWRIDIYRLGFYAGKGARRVATFSSHEENENKRLKLIKDQPDCYEETSTHLIDCGNWEPNYTWNIPGEAVSGLYIARFVREDEEHVIDRKNWRSDASWIAPNPKFGNPEQDRWIAPPCRKKGEEHLCKELEHSYGAQKRFLSDMGVASDDALYEPYASLGYFVIRPPAYVGAEHSQMFPEILVAVSDQTWQAYNGYLAPTTYGVMPVAHHNFSQKIENRMKKGAPLRAYKTSFNRPFVTRDVHPINMPFNAEYPLIRFLEANGYSVGYVSGLDVHFNREEILSRVKLLISPGHDEYWSSEQRKNVEIARDLYNMSMAFFSGNELYWNVRWEKGKFDALGNNRTDEQVGGKTGKTDKEKESSEEEEEDPTTMVIYKESQNYHKIDPDTTKWTGTFRDPRKINPEGGRPENAVTGTAFTVNSWRVDPLLVPYKYSKNRFWRNTQVANLQPKETGVLLKGLMSHEWDSDLDNGWRPSGLSRLSETTQHNVQVIVDHGSTFDGGSATHHLVMYWGKNGHPENIVGNKDGFGRKVTYDEGEVLGKDGKEDENDDKFYKEQPPIDIATDPDDDPEQTQPALTPQQKLHKSNQGIVFGAGCVRWIWGLDPWHDTPTGTSYNTENEYSARIGKDDFGGDSNVRQAMVNLFFDMGVTVPKGLLGRTYGFIMPQKSNDYLAPKSEFLDLKIIGDDIESGEGSAEEGASGSKSSGGKKKIDSNTHPNLIAGKENKTPPLESFPLLQLSIRATDIGGGTIAGLEIRVGEKDPHWHPATLIDIANDGKDALFHFKFRARRMTEEISRAHDLAVAIGRGFVLRTEWGLFDLDEGGHDILYLRAVDDSGNLEDPPVEYVLPVDVLRKAWGMEGEKVEL